MEVCRLVVPREMVGEEVPSAVAVSEVTLDGPDLHGANRHMATCRKAKASPVPRDLLPLGIQTLVIVASTPAAPVSTPKLVVPVLVVAGMKIAPGTMVAILVILTHGIVDATVAPAAMPLAVIVGMAVMPRTFAMLSTPETSVPEITTMPEMAQRTPGMSSAEGLPSARTLGRAEMAGRAAMVARAVTLDRAAMADRVLAMDTVVKVEMQGIRRAGMQGMGEKAQAEAVLQAI